ncbi:MULTISPECIES: hypothetical protein [Burkholderia]|uniref:hypothetical protein n=1 Tax=Burkholderia TaxID=32008 RepID=UPI0012E36A45|nr:MULTISPECIES: hypothetical protein [Burkholderia]
MDRIRTIRGESVVVSIAERSTHDARQIVPRDYVIEIGRAGGRAARLRPRYDDPDRHRPVSF